MKIKLEACQPYFSIPDPLYKLNDSPPMNAEQIGNTIKTLVKLTRESRVKGVIIPPNTYIDFGNIEEKKEEISDE